MVQFREYTVDLMEEILLKRFVIRKLVVINEKVRTLQKCVRALVTISTQTGSHHQVFQIHITNWRRDGTCSHLNTITNVLNKMYEVQRRTGNNPIIVHCR